MDQTETIEPKREILIPFEMALALRDRLNQAVDWGSELIALYDEVIPSYELARLAVNESIQKEQELMKVLETELIRMGAVEDYD